MANKFLLEMRTPDKVFFNGRAEQLIVDALDGKMGIMAHHAPVVIGLEPGMIKIIDDGSERILANGEGFVVVSPEKISVLCQTMEWPEEIELSRVNRAIAEHSEKLRQARTEAEYKVSKATLSRAFARLRVKNGKKES